LHLDRAEQLVPVRARLVERGRGRLGVLVAADQRARVLEVTSLAEQEDDVAALARCELDDDLQRAARVQARPDDAEQPAAAPQRGRRAA
jgi:hypothetical protein